MEPISILLIALGIVLGNGHTPPDDPKAQLIRPGWWRINNTNNPPNGALQPPGLAFNICLGRGDMDDVKNLLPRAGESSSCPVNAFGFARHGLFTPGVGSMKWALECGAPFNVIAQGVYDIGSTAVKGVAKIHSPPGQPPFTQFVNAQWLEPCDAKYAVPPLTPPASALVPGSR